MKCWGIFVSGNWPPGYLSPRQGCEIAFPVRSPDFEGLEPFEVWSRRLEMVAMKGKSFFFPLDVYFSCVLVSWPPVYVKGDYACIKL